MFGSKKKNEKLKEEEERKELIKDIIKRYEVFGKIPEEEKNAFRPYSLEYRIFKEEEEMEKRMNLYERLCKKFQFIEIVPGDETKKELEKAIEFLGWKIKPEEITTFATMTFFILFFAISLPSLFLPLPPAIKILSIIIPVFIAYYVYNYPLSKAAEIRVKCGKDLVLAVLYMIVYMKNNPNFEGAVRFAAVNLEGPLSKDLKQVLWKVEVGKYTNIEDALMDYLKKWKYYNKELIEAVHLIRQSMAEPSSERRDALLNKAIDLVLAETNEKMKKYARDLETPVTVLHAMGILLPVLGMIVFPLLSIFMGGAIKNLATLLFIGYDIILPVFIFFFLNQIFIKRPPTYTNIDLSQHPDYVPLGKFRIKFMNKKWDIPAYIPSILLFTILGLPLINFIIKSDFFYKAHGNAVTMGISVLFIVAIALSISLYFFLSCFQKKRLREEIMAMESEFEELMFALGSRLIDGAPIEVGIAKAEEDIKDLKISKFLAIVLKNMMQLSMTFKEAVFNKEYGALRYYPSKLISAIMKAIADAVDKGSVAAAVVMITISRYLRNIKTTQEKIDDLLSSVVSSLTFQGYVLIPAISGIVVSIAKIIMRILDAINEKFSQMNTTGISALGSMNPVNFFAPSAIPSEILQIIVGIYVVEILILTAIFITKIRYGDDKIIEHDTIWKMVLIGTIAYIAVFALMLVIFMPVINSALSI